MPPQATIRATSPELLVAIAVTRDAGDNRHDAERQARIAAGRRPRRARLTRGEPFGDLRVDPLLHLPIEPGKEALQHRVLVVRAELPPRADGGGQVVTGGLCVVGHVARIEPAGSPRRGRRSPPRARLGQ